MTQPVSPTPVNFRSLGIAENILKTLDRLGFTTPTPIQHHCIPTGIEGKDVIGIAQTGTGKTLAFGIPMIMRLARFKGKGLILLPTRELAIQVDEALIQIGGPIGLRTAVLIGGEPIGRQKAALAKKPHIFIATPGRLLDHMDQCTLRLDDVTQLVLDEADRMLDMGFAPQINRILGKLPKERQTMLFSATMPTDIVKIATHHMRMPVRVEVAPQGTAAEEVEQEMIIVPRDSKRTLLETLLKKFTGPVLVFSRTKYGAKKICIGLRKAGFQAAEIHSNRSLAQRRDALDGFKSGKYKVLVATDIAARGIDVQGIEAVINYDLPAQAEDYVHRIGRTGRAGREGRAISFAMPQEQDEIRRIERLIRKNIKTTRATGLPESAPSSYGDREERHFRPHSGGRSHQGKPFHGHGGQGGSSHRFGQGGGHNRSDRSAGGSGFSKSGQPPRSGGKPFHAKRGFGHKEKPQMGIWDPSETGPTGKEPGKPYFT
jgi:ATP-dependent RNA helicase RhlE